MSYDFTTEEMQRLHELCYPDPPTLSSQHRMSYQLTDEDMELVRAALARIADKKVTSQPQQRFTFLEEATAAMTGPLCSDLTIDWTDEARRVIKVVVRRLYRAHLTLAANWLASEINQ